MKSNPENQRNPQRIAGFAHAAAAALSLFGIIIALCAGVQAHRMPSPQPSAPPAATPVPAGPLSGMTILVDAGHGGYDGGARCRDSGIWEKELNLRVALQVEQALTRRGATVVMTRRTDTDLCTNDRPSTMTKKRQDMQRRVDMAVAHRADMVLSIHMNEYRRRGESGPQVFFRQGCNAGRLLAGCLQESLILTLSPRKQRTAMAGDYFILQLDVPSALVECGFISNPEEERLLLDDAYQAQLAQAVADGVEVYLRLQDAQEQAKGAAP